MKKGLLHEQQPLSVNGQRQGILWDCTKTTNVFGQFCTKTINLFLIFSVFFSDFKKVDCCRGCTTGRLRAAGPAAPTDPVSSYYPLRALPGGRDGLTCSKPLRRWGQRSGRNHNNGIVEAPVSPTIGTRVQQQRGRGVPQARPSRLAVLSMH